MMPRPHLLPPILILLLALFAAAALALGVAKAELAAMTDLAR
jgi:hypothetical protein